jgi:NADH-quinone oxidoreductase subunit H
VGADSVLNHGWLPVIWFFAKLFLLLFGFIWLRGTLPRLRYDQFMQLGWKVLVPINLLWIVIIVTFRAVSRSGGLSVGQIMIGIGVTVVLIVLLSQLLPEKQLPDDDYVPITGGGFPLPPLDLKVPETTPRQKALAKAKAKAAKRKPVAVASAPSRSNGVSQAPVNGVDQGGAQDGDV